MLFTSDEYSARVTRAKRLMEDEGLDYLIVLEPENVTYLTGFYSVGYGTSFQFVVLAPGGDPYVVTRIVERYWVDKTSAFAGSARYWYDGESSNEVLTRNLRELEAAGRVGIEMESWPATPAMIEALRSELPKLELVNVGLGLSRLRFVKSEAELAIMRRSGEIASVMLDAAVAGAKPGRTERELTADIVRAGVAAGSDDPFPGCFSSGRAAREIHASYGDRALEATDLVFAEVSAASKHYHARCMRSIVIGQPAPGVQSLARRLLEIQDEALASVRAGASCRIADGIYRRGIEETGAVDHYPNKTFYGVGLLLPPNGLEPHQVDPVSDFEFLAGTTWHTYAAVDGLNFSETIAVTESGFERLTTYPRELLLV